MERDNGMRSHYHGNAAYFNCVGDFTSRHTTHFDTLSAMKAFVIREPGQSGLDEVKEVAPARGDVLLKTRMVGFAVQI